MGRLQVTTIDTYIGLRVSFTSMDLGVIEAEVIARLVSWYNRLAKASDMALPRIRVPRIATSLPACTAAAVIPTD